MSWTLNGEQTATKEFELSGMRVSVSITHGSDQTPDDIAPLAEEIDKRLALVGHRFDPARLGLEEAFLRVLEENKILNQGQSRIQARSTELIQAARGMRRRLIELGDPDPGLP